jgi:hypothetical protein
MIGGSFVLSLGSGFEVLIFNIMNETESITATPAEIYGISLIVEMTICGFIIAPRMSEKIMIPSEIKNVVL